MRVRRMTPTPPGHAQRPALSPTSWDWYQLSNLPGWLQSQKPACPMAIKRITDQTPGCSLLTRRAAEPGVRTSSWVNAARCSQVGQERSPVMPHLHLGGVPP